MKLSVIIPVYDDNRHLKDLLANIGAHEDIEVIVVDDVRSKEKAYDVAAAAGAIYRTCDGDVSAARNLGAKIAKGEYLLFLDADQFLWSLDAIKDLLSYLDAYRLDIATSLIRQSWTTRNFFSDIWEAYRTLIPTLSGGFTLVRKAVFERLGGFRPRAVSLFTWEDFDLDVRARLAGYRIHQLPFVVVHRRSLTSSTFSARRAGKETF